MSWNSAPHNIRIAGNTLASNFQGIAIIHGESMEISGNTIVNNGDGLYIGASNCTVIGNNVTSNRNRGGVALNIASSNSTFIANFITDNAVGVTFSGSDADGNTFYANNFIDNTYNTKITLIVYTEIWDNGTMGNYWSDYTAKNPHAVEMDNTGVWNIPYVIDSKNTDYYPVTKPFAVS